MSCSLHVIGNVQLDVLASPVERLPSPGGDDIIDRIDVRPAGAAGNVSLALVALGVQHRLFGAVGDDQAGTWVAQELERAGVGADLDVVPGRATGISIALEAPGRERAFVTAHGVLDGYDVGMVPPAATRADLVLLTGYFSLPGLRGAGTRELLGRARSGGAVTVFDTGWDPEDWKGGAREELLDLLPLVDIFLPNEPEALALARASQVEEALSCLAGHCPGWVVLKRGKDGVVAMSPDGERFNISAPAVEPVDTTGAGDSLAAGMLADLAGGADMTTALTTGVRLASTVVGRPSHNRYPKRDELLQAPHLSQAALGD
jgi:sugar/nucleoside kinase (ribokinase family)